MRKGEGAKEGYRLSVDFAKQCLHLKYDFSFSLSFGVIQDLLALDAPIGGLNNECKELCQQAITSLPQSKNPYHVSGFSSLLTLLGKQDLSSSQNVPWALKIIETLSRFNSKEIYAAQCSLLKQLPSKDLREAAITKKIIQSLIESKSSDLLLQAAEIYEHAGISDSGLLIAFLAACANTNDVRFLPFVKNHVIKVLNDEAMAARLCCSGIEPDESNIKPKALNEVIKAYEDLFIYLSSAAKQSTDSQIIESCLCKCWEEVLKIGIVCQEDKVRESIAGIEKIFARFLYRSSKTLDIMCSEFLNSCDPVFTAKCLIKTFLIYPLNAYKESVHAPLSKFLKTLFEQRIFEIDSPNADCLFDLFQAFYPAKDSKAADFASRAIVEYLDGEIGAIVGRVDPVGDKRHKEIYYLLQKIDQTPPQNSEILATLNLLKKVHDQQSVNLCIAELERSFDAGLFQSLIKHHNAPLGVAFQFLKFFGSREELSGNLRLAFKAHLERNRHLLTFVPGLIQAIDAILKKHFKKQQLSPLEIGQGLESLNQDIDNELSSHKMFSSLNIAAHRRAYVINTAKKFIHNAANIGNYTELVSQNNLALGLFSLGSYEKMVSAFDKS